MNPSIPKVWSSWLMAPGMTRWKANLNQTIISSIFFILIKEQWAISYLHTLFSLYKYYANHLMSSFLLQSLFPLVHIFYWLRSQLDKRNSSPTNFNLTKIGHSYSNLQPPTYNLSITTISSAWVTKRYWIWTLLFAARYREWSLLLRIEGYSLQKMVMFLIKSIPFFQCICDIGWS